MRKLLTRSNLLNALFVGALLVLLFVPSAKALLIRGLMAVGFFRPSLEKPEVSQSATPNLYFQDASGNAVQLKELKGKVVFVNFWAVWCPPCIAEMPSINALHQKLKADTNIVFVMIDADGNLPKSKQFLEARNYNLPVYKVMSDVPESVYGNSLPTTVIFDKQGRIAFRHDGAANYDSGDVEQFLKQLVSYK